MEQDILTQSLSSNDCHCLSNILHTFFKPHSGSSLDSHYIQSPVPGPLKQQCHRWRARPRLGVPLLLAWPPGPALGSCFLISQPGPDLDRAATSFLTGSHRPVKGVHSPQTQHQESGADSPHWVSFMWDPVLLKEQAPCPRGWGTGGRHAAHDGQAGLRVGRASVQGVPRWVLLSNGFCAPTSPRASPRRQRGARVGNHGSRQPPPPLHTHTHAHAHAHAHAAGKQDLSAGLSAALSAPPGIGQPNGQTGSPGPDHAGLSWPGLQCGRLLLEAWEAGIRPLLVCPGSRLGCTLRSSWLARGSWPSGGQRNWEHFCFTCWNV